MATVRQSPPSSILLAPDSRHTSLSSDDSSTSTSPSPSSSHYSLSHNSRPPSAPSTRRIRFAPLPDPRRAVLITDDGAELPLPHSPDDLTATTTVFPDIECASKHSSWCDSSSSTGSSPSTPAQHALSLSPSTSRESSLNLTPTPTLTQPDASSTKSWRSLALFRKRRTDPAFAAPAFTKKNVSLEEVLSLGAINLFRPSSRTASRDTPSPPLARWASTASAPTKKKDPAPSPLSRSQSLNPPARGRPPKPKPAPPMPTPRIGTRMLNGRIYGAKRNPDPFSNARDEEPTFVEWGYGGMGSVHHGAVGGSVWGRVQAGSGVMVGSVETPPASRPDEDDGDDGSGMGWVKRRREQREREKKEREERELRESQASAAVEPAVEAPPAPEPEKPVEEEHVLSAVSVPAHSKPHRAHSRDDVNAPLAADGEEGEHILRAVNVPAPPHHHRSHSRDDIAPVAAPNTNTNTDDVESESESEDEREDAADDGDRRGEEEDDEDEDEDEETEAQRRTALGAGVEKISWHKEKQLEHEREAADETPPDER